MPFNDPLPWDNDDAPAVPRQLPAGFEHIRALDGTPPVVKPYRESCRKCGGRGRFVSYSGRDCGPCYSCQGKGYREFATSTASRTAAKARREEAKVGRWDTWKAANPAAAAWIEKTSVGEGSFNAMIADFQAKIERHGDLTDGQWSVVRKGLERDAQWAAERTRKAQEQASQTIVIDTTKIVEAFQVARNSGLRKAVLHFPGLALVDGKKGIYVKAAADYEATYYGKITDRFLPSRECSPEIVARLQVIAADPLAAARTTGIETGVCVCCGAELTNPESVQLGIGPICRGRWGF